VRLILSRKGFDSSSGGCPSPIFPDGSMLALPIPDKSSTVRYSELTWHRRNVGELVERLTRGKQRATHFAHLDPDLRAELKPRAPGWRAALGQEGGSQSHLRNQSVGVGDLFLFWGLFQRFGDDLRPRGRPIQALWGWLQVATAADVASEIVPALEAPAWEWAAAHPHVTIRKGQQARKKPNVLYVASEQLDLPGFRNARVPGAGVFERFRDELQLTADPDRSLSIWSLPRWFAPGRRVPLTYHHAPDRWTEQGDRVLLRTVGRGQEFVLDADEYPEALAWARTLITAEV
jgi:putative DNA base modification enzyme with NMAD domain